MVSHSSQQRLTAKLTYLSQTPETFPSQELAFADVEAVKIGAVLHQKSYSIISHCCTFTQGQLTQCRHGHVEALECTACEFVFTQTT